MNPEISRAGRPRVAGAFLVALAVAVPAGVGAQTRVSSVAPPDPAGTDAPAARTAESVIQNWPERSRDTARALIAEYGEPAAFSGEALVWSGNGAWKKTVVHRGAWPRLLVMKDRNYLEQAISYRVPEDKIAALKMFDSRVQVDPVDGELSSRAESEKMNYLALNMAVEIIDEKRSVEDASAFYRREAELAAAGKSSPYLEGFTFNVDAGASGAPGDPGTRSEFTLPPTDSD
ncbi:MAG: hypothetical protein HKL90_03295 [Elusimicrobia bacterium]|nr:hypothetical protein [Elusimicrobiota bacterium]